ncbi:hypothetical protein [Chitinophaga arvensicola]|uniref:Uncharacterized protein n=1 Tax=Chitinophaga arvensicola TaxID=29529 RepID=A0A1I0S515_9BACT|nr:hypothetical protein [Chitinophaga arvensicola]SEW49944.1 hypothetical protein SAMN04488122_3644 [Chitinophaga arvensicola]
MSGDINDNNPKVHIPVVVGNYFPFRLVLRENDTWHPTLDEINYKNYDYVKLTRLSTFIDVGISPLSLGISFSGSLILPAIPEYRDRELALNKFNETLGFFLLGGVYCEAIQPTDISSGKLFQDGYLKLGNGGSGYYAELNRAFQTKHVGHHDVIKLLNPLTIQASELEKAYQLGKGYFAKIGSLSPALLLNGTSNYVRNQWGESLIFLWTSIEQVINIIWVKEIAKENSEENVIEGRRTFLKDFRTWTTSTKIELLFQKDFITILDYQLLNKARKLRNDFVHNGRKLSQEQVKNALIALFRLISLTISSYEDATLLDETLETIYKNEREELFPKDNIINGVTHWLSIPPIPGDPSWGDKSYEIIEELVLKPLIRD